MSSTITLKPITLRLSDPFKGFKERVRQDREEHFLAPILQAPFPIHVKQETMKRDREEHIKNVFDVKKRNLESLLYEQLSDISKEKKEKLIEKDIAHWKELSEKKEEEVEKKKEKKAPKATKDMDTQTDKERKKVTKDMDTQTDKERKKVTKDMDTQTDKEGKKVTKDMDTQTDKVTTSEAPLPRDRHISKGKNKGLYKVATRNGPRGGIEYRFMTHNEYQAYRSALLEHSGGKGEG